MVNMDEKWGIETENQVYVNHMLLQHRVQRYELTGVQGKQEQGSLRKYAIHNRVMDESKRRREMKRKEIKGAISFMNDVIAKETERQKRLKTEHQETENKIAEIKDVSLVFKEVREKSLLYCYEHQCMNVYVCGGPVMGSEIHQCIECTTCKRGYCSDECWKDKHGPSCVYDIKLS